MRLIAIAAAALIVAVATQVSAQAPQNPPQNPPTRIRGTVEKVEGQSVLVKSRDGTELSIGLPQNGQVGTLLKASLADIKQGDFVGSAAIKGADGKLHAQEVLIFPDAMRGTGEGHYPWNLTADSTMTNGTVAAVAAAPEGTLLKLKHKDGENEIDVPPPTPIVRIGPAGDAGLLVPGAAVFVVAAKGPDGKLTALRMIVEKDGVKPPM